MKAKDDPVDWWARRALVGLAFYILLVVFPLIIIAIVKG